MPPGWCCCAPLPFACTPFSLALLPFACAFCGCWVCGQGVSGGGWKLPMPPLLCRRPSLRQRTATTSSSLSLQHLLCLTIASNTTCYDWFSSQREEDLQSCGGLPKQLEST